MRIGCGKRGLQDISDLRNVSQGLLTQCCNCVAGNSDTLELPVCGCMAVTREEVFRQHCMVSNFISNG